MSPCAAAAMPSRECGRRVFAAKDALKLDRSNLSALQPAAFGPGPATHSRQKSYLLGTGNRASGLRQCRAAESGRQVSSQAFPGNPGGRPKTPQTIEVRRDHPWRKGEAARERTLDALDTLATIMKDPKAPAAARISAAVALLDRGHGKPYQAVDVKDGVDLGLLSDEELYTLDAILSRASVPAPDPSRHYLTAR